MKDLGYKVYDKHVAFWGSPLSNFYPCEFNLDDKITALESFNNI